MLVWLFQRVPPIVSHPLTRPDDRGVTHGHCLGGVPLPPYVSADEKHSHCLTAKVYLPTIVCGRVLWHLGYTTEASAAAFTESYQAFQ